MRSRWAILLISMVLTLGGSCLEALERSPMPAHSPGEILIKLRAPLPERIEGQKGSQIVTGLSSLDLLNRQFRVASMQQSLLPADRRKGDLQASRWAEELSRIYLLRFQSEDDVDVEKAAAAYERDPHVVYAQPNYLNQLCVVPDDSLYGQQWALVKMQMPAAWDIEQGSEEVIVGIVDSGIDYDHRDLAANIWVNPGEDLDGNGQVDDADFNGIDDDQNGYVDDVSGWDFTDAPQFAGLGDYTDRDNFAEDDLGHGSHVSGIVAAVSDNGAGVTGLCWHAKLMPLRAAFRLSVGSFLEDDDVSAAIVYAADNGARVINMSWGDPRISPMVRDVIAYAYAKGCVLAAAAGNVNQPGIFYPGGFDQTIAVGASTNYDQRASFSSFGRNLDVLAPGSDILSTFPDDEYGTLGGTSMATAHVSGLAALILSKDPSLSAEQVRGIVNASAVDLGAVGWDAETGNGRVDGLRALKMEQASHVQITHPSTGTGVNSQVAIVGTALGAFVDRFGLDYGLGLSPDRYETILEPVSGQALEETLAVWEGAAQLPDTTCTIRLRAWQIDGQVTEDRVVIHVDHTPPVFQDVLAVRRLDADGYTPFVEWRTDDETRAELFFRHLGEETFSRVEGIHIAPEHSLDLSGELEPGKYQFYLVCTNAAGLTTVEDNGGQYYDLAAPFEMVERGGFLLLDELPLGYHFQRPVDLDQDGRRELLFMAFSDTSAYGKALAYEMAEDDTLEEAFRSEAEYLVWDAGDSDGDGKMEILGGGYATIYLFESPDSNSFPDPLNPVWTRAGVWGSQMADADGDGRMDIISKEEIGSDVVIFENRGNDSLVSVASLPNPTDGRNSTGTRFAVADFDGDQAMEILIGDSDGDIYIYEAAGDDEYENIWSQNTGLKDARYLAAGDPLEGGGSWFAVAANWTDVYDPSSTYWRVIVYQPTGDNEYSVVWSQEIAGVSSQGNGIVSADFTGDGNKEIGLCVLPDLYFLQRTAQGDFQPIWYSSCGFMYRPFVGDLQGDGSVEIAFNGPDFTVVLERGDSGEAPPAPSGLAARPLGVDRVYLEWMTVPRAAFYRLYRGLDYYELDLLQDGLQATAYLDSGLTENSTYWYAVTTVDSLHRESQFYSSVVSATPNAPPQMVNIEVITPRHVGLIFSEPMGPSAQVASHYQIDSDVGAPTSVILDRGAQRALLALSGDLVADVLYTVRGEKIYDATGVPLSAAGQSLAFLAPPDTSFQPLFIRHVKLFDEASLQVRFSEAVDPGTAEDTGHYIIEPALVPMEARVDSVQGDLVHLKISPLRTRGTIYTLRVDSIWNLGLDRTILPGLGDVASFFLPAVDLSQAVAVPNPFSPGRDAVLRFVNLPPEASVSIFTISGELVWTEEKTDAGGAISWAGINEDGLNVSSGVYLYMLRNGGETKRGKLVLIR